MCSLVARLTVKGRQADITAPPPNELRMDITRENITNMFLFCTLPRKPRLMLPKARFRRPKMNVFLAPRILTFLPTIKLNITVKKRKA